VNRIEYPPGVNIVRVMCTGMIEPSYVMRALEYGADGVVIVGCQMENCHYTVGNKRAQERAQMLWPLLDMMGLGAGRLRTEWINASERVKFARAMRDFSEQLGRLGPNPLASAAACADKKEGSR
jgi:F420-non-reducing hydrogenase iron-sulfur subunit